MIIAAEFALNRKDDSTVLYVDANNDLAPDRLLGFTKMDPPSMRRIRVVQESRAKHILNVLKNFDYEISVGHSQFHNNLRLMIIDSLPAIVYTEMCRGTSSGRCFQEDLSQSIKKIASQHGVSVILVNNAVSVYERGTRFSEGQCKRVKPAMGKYWLQIPNFRIFLHRDMSFRSIIRAVLEKSTRSGVGNSIDFTIHEMGIE